MSLDTFKEENWNLELASQDLNSKLAEAQAEQQKLDAEKARLGKQLTTIQQTAETHRIELERVTSTLAEERNKFETSLAQMRRSNAGLMRERSDLQGAVDGLKGELDGVKKQSEMRRAVSGVSTFSASGTAVPGLDDNGDALEDGDEDVFGTRATRRKTGDGMLPGSPADLFSDSDGDSLAGSPARPRGLGSNLGQATEIDVLRHSLAHAQRTITTLRGALQKDKEGRMRGKKAANGVAGDLDWEEDLSEEDSPSKAGARGERKAEIEDR